MKTIGCLRRWRWSASCAIAIALSLNLLSWHSGAADEEAVNVTQVPRVVAGEEVTDRVEVTVSDGPLRSGRTEYYVEATITNTSDDPLAGPLLLVVRGTGVEGLTVSRADGQLAAGHPAVRFLADGGELAPEETTEQVRILFSTPETLRLGQRRRFELDYVVVRESDARDRTDHTPRRTIGRPGIPAPPGGGVGGPDRAAPPQEPVGLEPEPDPISTEPEAVELAPEPEQPNYWETEPGRAKVQGFVDVQNEWNHRLLGTEGVHRVGTGLNHRGELRVQVHVHRWGFAKNVPEEINGLPVEVKVSTQMRRLQQWHGNQRPGVGQAGRPQSEGRSALLPIHDPRQRFARPIPIGVTAISNDAGCASGTLGCRVRGKDGRVFALSNFHVFSVFNDAVPGTMILHPSPGDNDCGNEPPNLIGRFSRAINIQVRPQANPLLWQPGEGNLVDAALARVSTRDVGRSTPRGGYGMPRSMPVEAALGMKVMKVGRTTGFTAGVITGVNSFTFVPFTPELPGIGLFIDQITVQQDPDYPATARAGGFGLPGDSGSLVVTNPGRHPVGLLFAGGGGDVLLNRIQHVLELLEVEIDGEGDVLPQSTPEPEEDDDDEDE